jgi:hypothetical protein
VAGYSNTPLPKKLGIKEGHRVAVISPPNAFEKTLGDLPREAVIQGGFSAKARFDVIVIFVTSRAELQQQIAATQPHMTVQRRCSRQSCRRMMMLGSGTPAANDSRARRHGTRSFSPLRRYFR